MTLVATAHILWMQREYRPGDILPDNTGMDEEWLKSGAAVTAEEYVSIPSAVKAERLTAVSGVKAINCLNAESEENFIGRIPITQRRRRR